MKSLFTFISILMLAMTLHAQTISCIASDLNSDWHVLGPVSYSTNDLGRVTAIYVDPENIDSSGAERAAETFHATTYEAATIAKKAGTGKLLIGHFSAKYTNLQPLLEEAREIFPNTELAEEGNTFEIPKKMDKVKVN